MTHHIHPWRRLRALGDEWTLLWRDLPVDTFGFTHYPSKTIVLSDDMTFEERRCTALHEVIHAERGPSSRCTVLAEETIVDRMGALMLLPSVREVADALLFNHANYDAAAQDLWVDTWTLEVRLATLSPSEREYLDERLADVLVC